MTAADGNRYWGRYGAAGLLAHDPQRGVLLQHRAEWTAQGGTWGLPGGARHRSETAVAASLRETAEETGLNPQHVTPRYEFFVDKIGWSYTTVIAHATPQAEASNPNEESLELRWVPVNEVAGYNLHPGLAATWRSLRPLLETKHAIIVDAANVIGTVPDGWWRDRPAANEKLRDRIAATAQQGIHAGFCRPGLARAHGLRTVYPEWVMVTEGTARDVASNQAVRVVYAPTLGDDTIVEQTAKLIAAGYRVTVATSDEELKTRVRALGAETRGSKKLLKHLTV